MSDLCTNEQNSIYSRQSMIKSTSSGRVVSRWCCLHDPRVSGLEKVYKTISYRKLLPFYSFCNKKIFNKRKVEVKKAKLSSVLKNVFFLTFFP